MVKATFHEAQEFLKSINTNDKVAIIHDTDMDGTCSGILAMEFCEKMKCLVEEFGFYRSVSEMKDFDISTFNKIIILDLGNNLIEGSQHKFLDKKVLLIDHHAGTQTHFGENILEYRTVSGICTSRSTWELCGGKEWLAIIGAYSDAGEKYRENDEWFNRFNSKLSIPLLEFKEEYIFIYSSILIFFGKDTKTPFNLIKKFRDFKEVRNFEQYWGPVEKEKRETVERFYKKHEMLGEAKYFYFEPYYDIKSPVINKISFADEKSTFIFAVPKENNRIGISTRSQEKKFNMDTLVRMAVSGLHNASGGGHPAAAGCYFDKKDLDLFKNNVLAYFKSMKNTHI